MREEMTDLDQNWEKRIQQCKDLAAENLAIIKRQDKLAVDLHQKNEVCQLISLETSEKADRQAKITDSLRIRRRELVSASKS